MPIFARCLPGWKKSGDCIVAWLSKCSAYPPVFLIFSIKKFLQISATIAWVLFCIWAATIFILSSLTGEELQVMPGPLLAFDKLVHALAFAAGAVLLALALKQTLGVHKGRLFWFTILGIALFGAFDEIHQLFTPGRTGADFLDWIADMIGGSIATTIFCFIVDRPNGTDPTRSPGPNPDAPDGN